MRTEAKNPTGADLYRRFLQCCNGQTGTRALLLRLTKCNAPRLFVALRAYVENVDLNSATKMRERFFRAIVRAGVRKHGVPSNVTVALSDRADIAFNTKRKGVAHCTESLAWLEYYIETKTGKRPAASELAFLIEATREALGRAHQDVLPEAIRAELSRFKRKNALWMKVLRSDITSF
jgi:hypothetical protein